MREFSFNLAEALTVGLVSDTRIQTDARGLQTCSGLRPSPYGLIGIPDVAFPSSGETQTADCEYLFGEDMLFKYTSSSSVVIKPVKWGDYSTSGDVLTLGTVMSATTSSESITVVDNGPMRYIETQNTWFLCNEEVFLTNCSLYSDWAGGNTDIALVPRDVCVYNGRPVYAGFYGDTFIAGAFFSSLWTLWLKYNQDFVHTTTITKGGDYCMFGAPFGGSWDKPFSLDCAMLSGYKGTELLPILQDCIRSKAIDFVRVPYNVVRKIAPLGNRLIAYTSRSMYEITPKDNGGYNLDFITHVGVMDTQFVCATPQVHYIVDVEGHLWKFPENAAKPRNLGFREYLAPLRGSDLRLCYDSVYELLHITGTSTGYTLYEDRLCDNSQLTTSIIPQGTNLYGTYRGSVPTTFTVVTQPMEVVRRAQKHIALVEVSYRNLSSVQVALDVKYTESDDWDTTAAIPVNKEGVVFPRVTCTDFRVRVTGSIDNRDTATLDKITVRWRPTDSRYIRGLTEQHASFSRTDRDE